MANFTKRYALHRLVWFEWHDEIVSAIQREKQIKNWRRNWKVWMIHEQSTNWDDLYPTLLECRTGNHPHRLPKLPNVGEPSGDRRGGCHRR